jgi:hypothetical protein
MIGMVFIADDLGAWLIAVLADAGRRQLTTLVRGTDQERALRQAATAAVRLTAQDLYPDSEDQAEHLAMVISEVSREPVPHALQRGQATLLEGLRTGIARQLAVLDDASLTGIGQSSAGVLGIQAGELAEKLNGHLVEQIVIRGAQGGSLFPLASVLGHNAAYLQGQQLKDKFDQLDEVVRATLAQLESPSRRSSDEPEKIYVHYLLTLGGTLDFDAAAWANAVSNERRRMVEAAVGERLDIQFDFYGGQGIAECVEGGELEFTTTTEAEIRARYEAEAIETASLEYAGIGDSDEWPQGLARPSATNSYVTEHDGVTYVVLRDQRRIVGVYVYDIDDGGYKALAPPGQGRSRNRSPKGHRRKMGVGPAQPEGPGNQNHFATSWTPAHSSPRFQACPSLSTMITATNPR